VILSSWQPYSCVAAPNAFTVSFPLNGCYRTMPISLAASSQTQIGSAPFSNFRQRLSQSIIGTKQLKVEETDSGSPFFIHTRNRAGCSPSLLQEVGLRICHPWAGARAEFIPRAWGTGEYVLLPRCSHHVYPARCCCK